MAPEADQRHRLVREADAALDRVGEAQQTCLRVVDADVDDLRVEDVAELVADEVVDRLQLELAGEPLLHAVDERQLGNTLPCLVQQPRPLQGGRDVLADVRQQLLVLVRVADALRVALHHEDAERLPVGLEGNAEPARVLRDDADELDLALLGQFHPPLVRDQLGLARAEHVGRRACRGAGAQLLPDVGVGPIGIELVDVERPVDQLPPLVVERDVEVVRVHELADDAVDRGVERLHVLRGARRLGDAVQGVLDLLGSVPLRLGGLQLLEAHAGGSQLGRELRLLHPAVTV